MTVSSTTTKMSYTGNGSTSVFAYTFKIFADTEIKVWVNGILQTLTTHYTVSGAGSSSGGNVTFETASIPASTHPIVFGRNIARTQVTDYVENDTFPAETHEAALDKLTLIAQEIDNKLSADIFKFAETVTDAGTVEISLDSATRSSKILSFDSTGGLVATQEIGVYTGNWAASTAYVQRDLIKDTTNNNIYICLTAHSSSGTQPISSNADVAKWALIVDAASASTSATAAATSATAAATSATAAATSATASATSSTSSATSATASATSATSASTSASSASSSATSATASATDATGAVGAVAWKYTFSTSTTMSDPGTGEIRFDNATLASVTNIAIDATSADTGNPDVSDLIASIDDGTNSTHEGYIFVRKHGTPATFMAYNVTGAIVDSTGWLQIPVTHASSGGTLSNADILYISFSRSGNVGATGLTGATGSTGPTGPTGPAGDASIGDIIALS